MKMAQKDTLHSADLYRFGKSGTSAGNSPSGQNEESDDQPVNINVYCEIEETGREKRRPGGLFLGFIGSILDGITFIFYVIVILVLLLCVGAYFS